MGRFLQEEPSEKTAYMRVWLSSEKGEEYKKRHREYMRDYRKKNGDRIKTVKKAAVIRARQEALTYYGRDGKMECNCCGESTWQFLQLDHKNGDGAEHRRELKKELGYHYVNMCYWAKKNGWPAIFQTLCANCNSAKGFYGGCPHQEN